MTDQTFRIDFNASKIDELCRSFDQSQLPGAAIGIAIKGTPVYRKGFGLASMELPIVLSPMVRMRIGSTTKHFAAFAFMLLCEQQKASIDDPLGKHLPELPRAAQAVTMRQLMGNTSGLRDVYDICWQFSGTGNRVLASELLGLYRDLPEVNAEPNVAWIYNNGGWLLLSAVIERIVGKDLEVALEEMIFKPLGMNDTMLRRFDTDFVANSATLHMCGPEGIYERSYLGTAMMGEGGMVSTVDDMLRWLAHMDKPISGRLSTWATMKEPLRLANGHSTDYALGLMVGQYRGIDILHHGGGVNGGGAQMLKVPTVGLDVIVITNRHDASAVGIANAVLDCCLVGLNPGPTILQSRVVTGLYRSPKTGRVIQLLRMDRTPLFSAIESQTLQVMMLDGLDLPMVRDERGHLRPVEGLGYLKQSVELLGPAEHPTGLRLSDFGTTDDFDELVLRHDPTLGELAGRYVSESSHTELEAVQSDRGAHIKSRGAFGRTEMALERLSESIWQARPRLVTTPGGILTLDDSKQKLRFDSPRTRAMYFQRLQ
jgi:D-aminopeptidase